MYSNKIASIYNFIQLKKAGKTFAVGAVIGIIVLSLSGSPFKLLLLISGAILLSVILYDLQSGLLILSFLTYTGISELANQSLGLPHISNLLAALLLAVIIGKHLITGRSLSGYLPILVFITAYGIIGISTLFYATNPEMVQTSLVMYFKGALLALVVVLLLTECNQIRGLIWALLAAGILLAALNCHQYFTGQFENSYWGFCQSSFRDIVGKSKGYRIGGPMAAPNFFAQFLLVLLPLSINRLWHEKSVILRILAGLAFTLISAAVILTYSRGGFLSILVMITMYLIMYPPKLRNLLLVLVLIIPMLALPSASYLERMKSLKDVIPGQTTEFHSDSSFKGRASEMLVAVHLFLEHPLLGVGWGNYIEHYRKYANKFLLDLRQESRKAHSRYLEVLAESGIVGLIVFVGNLYIAMKGVLRAQKMAGLYGLRDLEGIAIAFAISLTGFFTAFLFLHGDFQRYFWLLIGIAYALPNIVNFEISKLTEAAEPSSI